MMQKMGNKNNKTKTSLKKLKNKVKFTAVRRQKHLECECKKRPLGHVGGL